MVEKVCRQVGHGVYRQAWQKRERGTANQAGEVVYKVCCVAQVKVAVRQNQNEKDPRRRKAELQIHTEGKAGGRHGIGGGVVVAVCVRQG